MTNPFHNHLDECKQCRDNPWGLCVEGAKLLKDTAEASAAGAKYDLSTRAYDDLVGAYSAVFDENARLRERHEVHLKLVRDISTDSIPKDEADELHSQIAKMIAEIGTLKGRLKIKETEEKDLFYIQDGRQVVGNCALFWGPNGAGYVCDLNDAGVYSKDKALSIGRGRKSDIPWLKSVIDANAVLHCRNDTMRNLEKERECCSCHGDEYAQPCEHCGTT
jgi:hypothetical protein